MKILSMRGAIALGTGLALLCGCAQAVDARSATSLPDTNMALSSGTQPVMPTATFLPSATSEPTTVTALSSESYSSSTIITSSNSAAPTTTSASDSSTLTVDQVENIARDTFGAPPGAPVKYALMTYADYEKQYADGETTPAIAGGNQVWLVTVFGEASKFINTGPPGNTLNAAPAYSVVIDALDGRVIEYINAAKLSRG